MLTRIQGTKLENVVVASSTQLTPHNGLVINSASDTTVTFSAAQVLMTDSDGQGIQRIDVPDITMDIETNGVNGLDQDPEINDRWVYIWAIDNGLTTAGLLSLSATSPQMPAGYTFRGLIGAVYNNGTGNFVRFKQLNNSVTYNNAQVDFTGSAVTIAPQLRTLTVPPNCRAHMVTIAATASSQVTINFMETFQTETSSLSNYHHIINNSTVLFSIYHTSHLVVDDNSQIKYNGSVNTGTVANRTLGYEWI